LIHLAVEGSLFGAYSQPDRKNEIDYWAAPKYWAEVAYRDITSDGLLRHVTFRGLYASRTAKKPLIAKFK
jgi:ATP-dependent DNA ligase